MRPKREMKTVVLIAACLTVSLSAAAPQSTATPATAGGPAPNPATAAPSPATNAPSPATNAPSPATTAPSPATAAPSPATAAPSPATTTTLSGAPDPVVAKRRQTILYGIDSELIDLFGTLAGEKDSQYNADIKTVFEQSRNPKLRAAILDLWKALDWKGGEDDAAGVVSNRDNEDSKTVVSAYAYLAEIKSTAALGSTKTVLDENNRTIVPALISYIGLVGGDPEVDILLAWLKGDTAEQAYRESAIRALGDMKAVKAVDWLVSLLGDNGAQRYERIIAAESLGKIGAPAGQDALIKAARGDDTLIQASAVGALGAFDSKAADEALVEALRDSYPQTRVAACKGVAKRKLLAALPNLEYKARNDPDKGVQTEALRSLAALGSRDAFAFLASEMDDASYPAELRQLSFGLLMRKDAAASMDRLLLRLKAEASTVDRSFYTSLTREIAGAADAPAATPLARFLMQDKDYLIRLGGLQWARATKSPDIKADVATLAAKDPNDAVKRLAAQILAAY